MIGLNTNQNRNEMAAGRANISVKLAQSKHEHSAEVNHKIGVSVAPRTGDADTGVKEHA